MNMKNLVLRLLCAGLVVWALFYLLPLFFAVIGLSAASNVWALIRACVVVLAVFYVVFGSAPPAPF